VTVLEAPKGRAVRSQFASFLGAVEQGKPTQLQKKKKKTKKNPKQKPNKLIT
jgi:hypothetical protein